MIFTLLLLTINCYYAAMSSKGNWPMKLLDPVLLLLEHSQNQSLLLTLRYYVDPTLSLEERRTLVNQTLTKSIRQVHKCVLPFWNRASSCRFINEFASRLSRAAECCALESSHWSQLLFAMERTGKVQSCIFMNPWNRRLSDWFPLITTDLVADFKGYS